MFTGIVEALGEIEKIEKEESNVHFTLNAPFVNELKIDQSIAHDGCCLTVVDISAHSYTVTAIHETLDVTKLSKWIKGDFINLERCMTLTDRLDGHIVQGHVDEVGVCKEIQDENGSWKFTFTYESENTTVNKGSITINGVSLTVVDSKENEFSVCIIPYTYENTNFNRIKLGDSVNLEFDIIGKYVARLLAKTK